METKVKVTLQGGPWDGYHNYLELPLPEEVILAGLTYLPYQTDPNVIYKLKPHERKNRGKARTEGV